MKCPPCPSVCLAVCVVLLDVDRELSPGKKFHLHPPPPPVASFAGKEKNDICSQTGVFFQTIDANARDCFWRPKNTIADFNFILIPSRGCFKWTALAAPSTYKTSWTENKFLSLALASLFKMWMQCCQVSKLLPVWALFLKQKLTRTIWINYRHMYIYQLIL